MALKIGYFAIFSSRISKILNQSRKFISLLYYLLLLS